MYAYLVLTMQKPRVSRSSDALLVFLSSCLLQDNPSQILGNAVLYVTMNWRCSFESAARGINESATHCLWDALIEAHAITELHIPRNPGEEGLLRDDQMDNGKSCLIFPF